MDMKLTIQSHIPKLVVKSPSPQVSGILEVLTSGHILEKAGFMMNGAIYRRLSMASTSVRNIALTAPSSRLLRTMQDLQQGAVEGIRGVSATELLGSRRRNNAEEDEDEEEIASISIDKGDTPDSKAWEEKHKARLKSIPAAGTQEVNQIAIGARLGARPLRWHSEEAGYICCLYYRRRWFTDIEAGQQKLATCSTRIAAYRSNVNGRPNVIDDYYTTIQSHHSMSKHLVGIVYNDSKKIEILVRERTVLQKRPTRISNPTL